MAASQELTDSRRRFVERVKAAIALTSPTRRTALYQEWRKLYGDNVAREQAKYAESIVAGQRTLEKLEAFLI